MSSKREEERNEKIIRGLMKLPPNRRCINCNNLGPQYVCINFWTFVCMTCSGIHREFTHRVKSVSMSMFTSREVEALQNGGNQRAKEMILKDWDFQRQRLPSGNNIEKIREFIKHVYVDRKYVGGESSEKPPRDLQSHRKTEAETRRASSYHSYSQSPPYDFQYEERRNRKQGVMLTRNPGSDRGLYEGKVSGLYSPGRYSDHVPEERFTIEGSSSQVSDYSLSSGGDPFRSHPHSPNFLKDSGFNSPTFDYSKDSHADEIQHQTEIAHPEIHVRRDGVAAPNGQRMVSSAAYGDGSAVLNSVNSASLFDAFPQADQSSVAHQNKAATVPSSLQSIAPANTSTLDLFKEPHGKHPADSVPSVDLFQSPVTLPVVDLFQTASESSASLSNLVSSHASLPSLSFFEENSQNSSTVNAAYSESAPSDVGWATFDLPQHTSSNKSHDFATVAEAAEHSKSGSSVGKFNPLSMSNANTQWPEFLGSIAHVAPPLLSSPLHENLPNDHALAIASNSQEWRPFDDIDKQQERSGQVSSDNPSTADHFMGSVESEYLKKAGSQNTTTFGPVPGLPLHVNESSSSINQSAFTFMGELHSHFERNSSNPFDIPFDAELDASNSFYDMSTLQAALPSADFPSSFAGGINDSWFLQDAANLCVTTPPPGGISYMAAQAPSSQLPNVQTHGPVASIGGNPFA